jgi:hypothetical protein
MRRALFLGLMTVSASALATPTVTTWNNPECRTGNCEVKAMRLFVEKSNSGSIAGNVMSAEIEAQTPNQIRDYAFVQYIKGCIYETDGQQTRFVPRDYLGRSAYPFKHPTWEIDSGDDRDPVYYSYAQAGYDEVRGFVISRNTFYQSSNPLLNERSRGWGGKPSNLSRPSIFVHDAPTFSTTRNQGGKTIATVASLAFRICLHKIAEVPESVTVGATIIPNPIHCMEWSSNYRYDFGTRRFSERAELDPVCLR